MHLSLNAHKYWPTCAHKNWPAKCAHNLLQSCAVPVISTLGSTSWRMLFEKKYIHLLLLRRRHYQPAPGVVRCSVVRRWISVVKMWAKQACEFCPYLFHTFAWKAKSTGCPHGVRWHGLCSNHQRYSWHKKGPSAMTNDPSYSQISLDSTILVLCHFLWKIAPH